MSYILDAIKKAENKRAEDQVPSLESVTGSRHQRSREGFARMLIYGLICVLAVTAMWLYRETLFQTVESTLGQARHWGQSTWQHLENRLVGGKEKGGSAIENQSVEESHDGGPVQDPSQETELETLETEIQVTAEQQAILNSLTFSVISYSRDENKRFVMDGSTILREGDAVRGFTILKIEPRSVTLDVDGKHYSLNY